MYNLHYPFLLPLLWINAGADNKNAPGRTLPGPGDSTPESSSSTLRLSLEPDLFFVGDGVYTFPARGPAFTPVFVGGGGGSAHVSCEGVDLADRKTNKNLRPKKAIFTGYLDKAQSMGDLFYVDAGTGASLRRITHSADLERLFTTLPFETAF